MDLKELSDPLYINWIKAGLAMHYLKKGLEDVVEVEMKNVYAAILKEAREEIQDNDASCDFCTTANVIHCPTFGVCFIKEICSYHDPQSQDKQKRPCPKKICDTLYTKIKRSHRYNKPTWKATDARQWCTNYFEVMSCFSPEWVKYQDRARTSTDTWYKDIKSVTEVDLSWLLSYIINCKPLERNPFFTVDPPNDVFSQMRQTRNELFHSATLKKTDDELDELISRMVSLLEKLLDTKAKESIKKLYQLRDKTFSTTPINELEVHVAALNVLSEEENEVNSVVGQTSPNTTNQIRETHVMVKHMYEGLTKYMTNGELKHIHQQCMTKTLQMVEDGRRHQLQKEYNDVLSQTEVERLAKCMLSVGNLIGGKMSGTVFRVGQKYVMTALHLVRSIIETDDGSLDYSRLEDENICINFNENLKHVQRNLYHVKRCYEDEDLDIAVLEITNADADLPEPLILGKDEIINNIGYSVSIIGYGMSDSTVKHLDPRCMIVPNVESTISEAQAWVFKNRGVFNTAMQIQGKDPSTSLDWTYDGGNSESHLAFHCLMMHGASGAPILEHRSQSLKVVGILTHSLPKGVWELPPAIQELFPKCYKIEMGPKMSHIRYAMQNAHVKEHLFKELFPNLSATKANTSVTKCILP